MHTKRENKDRKKTGKYNQCHGGEKMQNTTRPSLEQNSKGLGCVWRLKVMQYLDKRWRERDAAARNCK